MKLSEQWLREWVSPKADAKALAERVTLSGIEIGAIEPVAPPLTSVVVGRVKTVAVHPTQDRLKVCTVEAGSNKNLQIVCGAPNVTVGMKAPLALPGAVLPGDRQIKVAAVHGIESAGMLCSSAELGLDDNSAGLMVLDKNAKIGDPIAKALGFYDVTMEVELTPNRGDCLSVAGMAREIAAITSTPLKAPKTTKVRVKSKKRVVVKVLARAECPHYVGRVVQNVDPSAVTPMWMRERLRRSGVRSISPVVDVTNYVMLELGQPMHAFDLGKLKGNVQVRLAKANEKLATLDARTITVPTGALVIADDRGPIALAGVMGGQETAVDGLTTSVFLESAYFTPDAVAGPARALSMITESSQRFERGVDPALQVRAIERATELLLAIAGGAAGPMTEVPVAKAKPMPGIPLRRARLMRMLGLEIPTTDVEKILKRLGMLVKRTAQGWQVVPPSYRFDMRIEEDLIEEVARLYGYDRIPPRLPMAPMVTREVSEGKVTVNRLRSILVDRDYQEVITYSFVDPELQRLIDPTSSPLMLANPISTDMAAMRTSLWPGLLQASRYNRNRQQERIRLFEIGHRFVSATPPTEDAVVAGVVAGPALAPQWGAPKRDADFYDVKADVEELLRFTARPAGIEFVPAAHPALHPGQTAAIHFGGRKVGWVGALHPSIQTRLDLGRTMLFELELAVLTEARIPAFVEISKFPAVRFDLSLVVSETVPAQLVLNAAQKVAGKLLVDLELFDEYRGEGIDSGRKSLSLTLTLQDSSRTLREVEVDAVRAQVVEALKSEFGAELRQ